MPTLLFRKKFCEILNRKNVIGITTISRVLLYFTNNFYRLPTKLRDGYVFSRVCLSVILFTGRGIPCDHYPQFIGPHHTVTPPNTHTPDIAPHGTGTPPPPDMFKLVHYAARTVGKRTVGILQECFLVTIHFY